MKRIRINLWTTETYPLKEYGEFVPNLVGYLHDDGKEHPVMLIVPGGGYYVVSPTESRLPADKFFNAGYHTFILTYTVICGEMRDFLKLPQIALGNLPLLDVSRAVSCIRAHADEWLADSKHIALCGFSAGAHLVCSLAVHFHQDFVQKDAADFLCGKLHSNRPDAVILCYPVITADSRFWHDGSILALTGPEPTPEQLHFYSLEKQVTPNTPPVFLWHTMNDNVVPVENSLLFMQALRRADVPCELHLFPEGPHGLSTADQAWEDRAFGEDSELCMEPFLQMLLRTAREHPETVPECAAPLLSDPTPAYFAAHWNEVLSTYRQTTFTDNVKKDDAAAVWPTLAQSFLKRFGF